MKLSASNFAKPLNYPVLFYASHWAAWVVSALALALPSHTTADLPRDAGLLVLAAILNVLATALASTYVRTVQRRPLLLALDGLSGMALIWASGGNLLPFFPLALAALVLPSAIYGWRGALWGCSSMIFADLIGLGLQTQLPMAWSEWLVRASLPCAASVLILAAVWYLRGRKPDAQPVTRVVTRPTAPPIVMAAPDPLRRPDNLLPPVLTRSGVDRPILAQAAAAERAAAPLSAPPRTNFTAAPGTTLPFAIEQLATNFGQTHSIAVQFNHQGVAQVISPAYQGTLLRLIYEALLNIHQHANAHHALIALRYETEQLVLSIQDDGVGLLDGTHERPGIHALRALRYRIAELDGHLDVFEGENGGVTVRAVLPLERRD